MRRNLLWPALWAVLIAVLTLMPVSGAPRFAWLQDLPVDKLVHLVLFGVQAALLALLMARQGVAAPLLWAFVASTGYGALIEVLQQTMGLGRTAEWGDLLADALGALVGILAIRRWLPAMR